jgi:hypothetical protein
MSDISERSQTQKPTYKISFLRCSGKAEIVWEENRVVQDLTTKVHAEI